LDLRIVWIIQQQLKVGVLFGIEMFDWPGPYLASYDFGVRSALAVLWKSEEPGWHETKQKYSGVPKVRTVADVSIKGLQDNLCFKDGRVNWTATTAPSESVWHRLFMQGYHARVGEQRKQDMAITIEQMLKIQEILEWRWQEAVRSNDQGATRQVAEIAVFFEVGYCGSLCGFEMPKIVLTKLKNQMQLEPTPQVPAHIGIPL